MQKKKLLVLFPIIPEAAEGDHVQSVDVRTAGVCVSLGRGVSCRLLALAVLQKWPRQFYYRVYFVKTKSVASRTGSRVYNPLDVW